LDVRDVSSEVTVEMYSLDIIVGGLLNVVNASSGSIKSYEFLNEPSYDQLLGKNFASLSYYNVSTSVEPQQLFVQ
jgi:hypothetical protein